MLKVSAALFGPEEVEATRFALIDDGYLGMGKITRQFEEDIKKFIGSNRLVSCVNTGTSALQLALQACGVGPGDEVLIPSVTYVASFQATSATGAKAVACDVKSDTAFIDIEDCKKRLTPKTKAIMPVHYAGQIDSDIKKIYQFAKENGLRIIEDAAHAFGTVYPDGSLVGSKGDIICFSFDSIKNITCGEGGAVITGDEQVHKLVNDLRLLAVKNDSAKRVLGERSWQFDVAEQGWRYHMSNLNAAIGREQLKKLPMFTKIRQDICSQYMNKLKNISEVKIIINQNISEITAHIFPIIVENKRDELRGYLKSNGIETGIHYQPNHLISMYKADNLPVSDRLGLQLLSLPLHCKMQTKDVDFVCQKITDFFIR